MCRLDAESPYSRASLELTSFVTVTQEGPFCQLRHLVLPTTTVFWFGANRVRPGMLTYGIDWASFEAW